MHNSLYLPQSSNCFVVFLNDVSALFVSSTNFKILKSHGTNALIKVTPERPRDNRYLTGLSAGKFSEFLLLVFLVFSLLEILLVKVRQDSYLAKEILKFIF